MQVCEGKNSHVLAWHPEKLAFCSISYSPRLSIAHLTCGEPGSQEASTILQGPPAIALRLHVCMVTLSFSCESWRFELKSSCLCTKCSDLLSYLCSCVCTCMCMSVCVFVCARGHVCMCEGVCMGVRGCTFIEVVKIVWCFPIININCHIYGQENILQNALSCYTSL